MAVTVKPVSTKKELKIFRTMHKKHYKGHRYYIPELDLDLKMVLDRKKNPFFKHGVGEFFLAWKDGKPVGRITAQVNHKHNEIWRDNIGWFGFWITPNDREVAFGLLDTAIGWLREQGVEAMRGPANLEFPEMGLLVDGFTTTSNMMLNYNYYYYQDLLEEYKSENGYKFEGIEDLLCYYYDVANSDIPEKIKRINGKLMQRSNYTIRKLNPKKFDVDVDNVFRIYKDAWAENFGSVPLEEESLEHIKEGLKMIVDKNMIFFVENAEGEVIAFQIVLPDVNEMARDLNGSLFWPPWHLLKFLWRAKVKRTEWVRLFATGIVKEYRKKGIDAMLYEHMIAEGKKRGYKHCDISWQLESNYDINRAIEAVGGRLYRRLRLYELPFHEDVKSSRPEHTAHTTGLEQRISHR